MTARPGDVFLNDKFGRSPSDLATIEIYRHLDLYLSAFGSGKIRARQIRKYSVHLVNPEEQSRMLRSRQYHFAHDYARMRPGQSVNDPTEIKRLGEIRTAMIGRQIRHDTASVQCRTAPSLRTGRSGLDIVCLNSDRFNDVFP